MITRRNTLGLMAAGVLSLLLLGTAEAGTFSLVPISQDFEPSGREATQNFRLDNMSNEQVVVTVKVKTRAISLDGVETNEDTQDFTVFPSRVVLDSFRSQVVRVQWNGNAKPLKELAYRVMAEQLPVRSDLAPQSRSIQLRTSYVGTIYVTTPGDHDDVVLESTRQIAGPNGKPKLEVVLNNRGRAHTLIDAPALTLAVGSETKTFRNEQLKGLFGENMLAQSKRRFVLDWPADIPVGQPTAKFAYVSLR